MFVNNYSWSAGGPLNLARGWVYWPLLCHRCHQCCHPFGSRAHILSAALWRTLLQWSLSVGATRLHGPGVSHRDQSGPPAWAQGPLSIGQWLGGAGGGGGGGGGVGAGDLDAPPHTHTHPSIFNHTHTTSKWQCNPLTTYGVPSVKHELDMETTCICIHVTAGAASPGQPEPITERLLFSSCGS